MTRFVLDCSVTMAWCFGDQATAFTDVVRDSLAECEAVVPAIWPLEVANVLLVGERHGRLTSADSTRFIAITRRDPSVHFD